MLPQGADEALHAVVAVREGEIIDQVLVDGLCVAAEPHLLGDELAVHLAGGGRKRQRRQGGWKCDGGLGFTVWIGAVLGEGAGGHPLGHGRF